MSKKLASGSKCGSVFRSRDSRKCGSGFGSETLFTSGQTYIVSYVDAEVVELFFDAGATFGVTPVAGVPALAGCTSAQGACMALCTPLIIVPTP